MVPRDARTPARRGLHPTGTAGWSAFGVACLVDGCPLLPRRGIAALLVLCALSLVAFAGSSGAADSNDPNGMQAAASEAEQTDQQPTADDATPAELSPEERRRRDLTEAHGAQVAEAILAGEVLREMTMEQVLLARGEPERKEVIPPDAALWHYPGGEVAFSGGKVSYVSLAPPPAPPTATDSARPARLPPPAARDQSAAPAPENQVPAPPIAVGDTYVYESRAVGSAADKPGARLVTRRAVIGTDGRITMTSLRLSSRNAKPRTLYFDGEWNLLGVRNSSGSGLDYSPPLQYYDFPLFPGKTWRQATTERNIQTRATRQHVLTGTVRGWELVSVPAGTFRGIKVELQTELFDPDSGERILGTDTSWYVPEVRRSVKSVMTAKGGRQRIIELQSYEVVDER